MSDRYTRRPSDGEQVCATCGSLVSDSIMHDAFHARIDLISAAIPVSMIETSGQRVTTTAKAALRAFADWESPEDAVYDEPTATDWQAAHDAGEDEEMFYGATHTCGLCGHRGRFLGGSVTEPGQPTVHLCHGCDEGHDCYHRWTVYGVRPHTDDCRDLYCGGCEEVK